MATELQLDYQRLTKELEQSKTTLVRAETNLEQKQREVKTAKAKLKELTTLDDTTQIGVLLQNIETEIQKLVDEAKELLQEVNQVE